MRKKGSIWKKVANNIVSFQTKVLLGAIYFLVLSFAAVLTRFISTKFDPGKTKKNSNWHNWEDFK